MMRKRVMAASLALFMLFCLSPNKLCAQEAAPKTTPTMVVSAPPSSPAIAAPEAEKQVAPAATEVSPKTEEASITLRDIFIKGGWIMVVIAGLSFVAIALTIFYLLTIRRGLLFPDGFLMDARDAAENNDIEALKDICVDCPAPAARIVAASLDQIVPGQAIDYNRLRDAMEDEGGRQASALWQRLQYLMDIAVISPMVGLLGTVWGMMISFGGIENSAEFAKKAETLASGISQAMYTTFGGLIVGIFAMALYDILRGRLNKLIGEMESACGSVLKRLASTKKA